MNASSTAVYVKINSRIFRRFAMFDTFHVKRRIFAPLIFAAIFLSFSAVAFTQSTHAQSRLIGTLLLMIGLGLPLVYVLHFLLQVHDQCKRLGLKNLRPAYTLILHETKLHVINDMKIEAEVSLPWDSLYGVWRGNLAYYIYATPSHAFILPDGQYGLSPNQMYAFLKAHVPADRLHGKP